MGFSGIRTERYGALESAADLSRGSSELVEAWDGFGLQISHFPPGEIQGSLRFVGHCVIAQFSPSAPGFTKKWKERGKESLLEIASGEIALSSGQEIADLRWNQAQTVIALSIEDKVLRQLSRESRRVHQPELRLQSAVADSALKHMLLALAHERRAGSPAGAAFSEALGYSIATYVLNRHAATDCGIIEHKGGLAPALLRRAQDHIHSNLACDLRLSDVAGVINMSPWHFGKAFKVSTGTTVHQYILTARMQLATSLLRDRRFRVCDVAAMIGVPNQSRFAAVFHKCMGCTPGSYRAALSLTEPD